MKIRASIVFALSLTMALPVAAELQDPTRPPIKKKVVKPVVVKKAQQKWALSYTLVSDQRRIAVINNKVVAVGEMVDGARVVEIESDAVTLKRVGKSIKLELISSSSTAYQKESVTP
ncbi:hypothetical protein [Candidatus Reidiella endopervernicosa]|nr:hypothetical protein [Candidatus Reidiella endopervernicosa]QKQ25459.1 hypothetical protein HUE57_03455 [Candidatus Reidiella endopervernicosa]